MRLFLFLCQYRENFELLGSLKNLTAQIVPKLILVFYNRVKLILVLYNNFSGS